MDVGLEEILILATTAGMATYIINQGIEQGIDVIYDKIYSSNFQRAKQAIAKRTKLSLTQMDDNNLLDLIEYIRNPIQNECPCNTDSSAVYFEVFRKVHENAPTKPYPLELRRALKNLLKDPEIIEYLRAA